MSCADSSHTRYGGISEQRFWLYATISAVLHIMVAIIIGHSTIAANRQMKPMETYLIASPASSASAPQQATIPARSFSDSQPTQAAATVQPVASLPLPAAAPMKASQTDTSHVIETTIAHNPVHQPPETGVPKGGSLAHAAQIPTQTGVNTGIATVTSASGVKENLGDMAMGDTGAPQFIHREPPAYPFLARKLGKEGKVIVRLTLDELGRQKDIEVVEPSGFGFTDAAVAALKKSVFSPARKNGKSVASRVLVPVRFALND